MIWVVAALVVVNVAFLMYLLVPNSDEPAVAASSDTPPPARTTPTPAAGNENANPAGSDPKSVARQPTQPPATQASPAVATPPQQQQRQPLPRQRGLTGLRLSPDPVIQRSNPASASRGSVTYSTQPLNDNGGGTGNQAPAPRVPVSRRPPSTQQPGDSVPEVTINGQLYSSVPGRSFILVEGRRYHEGERLAAGPAVESIDRRGATLNYRGQRYHVEGPG